MWRSTWSLFFGTALLAPLGALAPDARAAQATCFCVMSKDNLVGVKHRSGVCPSGGDLTGYVNKVYSEAFPQREHNQMDCNNRCKMASNQFAGSATGTVVRPYSAVGAAAYRAVSDAPKKCPPGWTSNTPQTSAGITPDGKCKRAAGQLTAPPYPPNGWQITNGTTNGLWGFTWGNGVYAWGTSSNGGAAVSITCNF